MTSEPEHRVTPKALRAWRLRMELTQAQCARLYGCSPRQWAGMEIGERKILKPVTHWMRLWEFHDRHVVPVEQKENLR